jgi:hypothetical protein
MRILIAALLLSPLPAAAQDFHCRNTAAEIRCVENSCQVETESFTPMELRRNGATLSICSYSACWKGPIAMRRTRGGVTFLSAEVRADAPAEPGRAPLAVMYDQVGTAQIRWLGFSNAMTCK